jgi:hypothetical protein
LAYVTIETKTEERINKTNERKLLIYACLEMRTEIELVVNITI